MSHSSGGSGSAGRDGGDAYDAGDLAYRYGMPSRTNRVVAGVLIGVLVLGAGGFLAWTVVFNGSPEVQSRLTAFDVSDPHEAEAVVEVVRKQASTAAVCQLQAQATDHAVVGELTLPVTDGPETQTLRTTIRTERVATTVVLLGCTAEGQPRPR